VALGLSISSGNQVGSNWMIYAKCGY